MLFRSRYDLFRWIVDVNHPIVDKFIIENYIPVIIDQTQSLQSNNPVLIQKYIDICNEKGVLPRNRPDWSDKAMSAYIRSFTQNKHTKNEYVCFLTTLTKFNNPISNEYLVSELDNLKKDKDSNMEYLCHLLRCCMSHQNPILQSYVKQSDDIISNKQYFWDHLTANDVYGFTPSMIEYLSNCHTEQWNIKQNASNNHFQWAVLRALSVSNECDVYTTDDGSKTI